MHKNKNKQRRRTLKKKFTKILGVGLVLALLASMLIMAAPVMANDVLSSTMYFEGELTLEDEHLVGTIPMLPGYYAIDGPGADEYAEGSPGPEQGGFDIYAKAGGTTYCDWYSEELGYQPPYEQPVIGHDGYPVGGWDDGYTPDISCWHLYELELTSDHWYLQLREPYLGQDRTSPMSGALTWYEDGTGYAEETDLGTIWGMNLLQLPVEIPYGESDLLEHGGGPQAFDWAIGYIDIIPLEYPGFDVAVTEMGGVYTVTLTPAPKDGVDVTVDVTQPILTLNIEGNGTVFVCYGTSPGADPVTPADPSSYVGPGMFSLTYPTGTIVSLVAGWTDSNYMFDLWTGVDPHYFMPDAHAVQVTLDTDKVATVTFVEKFISIEISPLTINFGPIMQGGTGIDTLNVANLGNVPIDVEASLKNEVPAGFYTANLKMDGSSVASWSTNIPASNSVDVLLTLEIPSDAGPGAKTGTIIFWAQETQ